MAETIWLSRAELDILWEHLGVGAGPYPIDIAHHGRTVDERARIRTAVFGELARRGLARDDRPEPRVADAVRLLGRCELAIAVVALLDPGHDPLLARAGASGEHAVLGVLGDDALRLSQLRPAMLPSAVVALIPDCPPGPGHSVVLPRPAPAHRRADEEPVGYLDDGYLENPGPARRRNQVVDAIVRRPRLRIGQFSVIRHACRTDRLAWFDTHDGRYLSYARPGQDGRDWTTLAPADNARLTATLTQIVTAGTARSR